MRNSILEDAFDKVIRIKESKLDQLVANASYDIHLASLDQLDDLSTIGTLADEIKKLNKVRQFLTSVS